MKCPQCDAETAAGDLVCSECGSELPGGRRQSHRPRWLWSASILGVLAICCLVGGAALAMLYGRIAPVATETPAAASPAPSPSPISTTQATPEVSWSRYDNGGLGISLLYPQDWLVEEDTGAGQVVFAPQEEDLQVSDFLRGTSMAVAVERTAELGLDSAEETLRQLGDLLSQSYPDVLLGEKKAYEIGGQPGALFTIEGEFNREGVRLQGWVAAAVTYERAYVFAAAAPVEEWTEQQPTLQAMLDSVSLSTPEPLPVGPTSTPDSATASTTPTTAPAPTPMVHVPVPGPDQYEPDDSIDSAKPISTDGVPQAHNLHAKGDHDYVRFEAREGYAYVVETLDLAAEIDTVIFLLDGDDQLIARNDDGTDEPLASRITWVAPGSGTYYVMARDLAEDASGPDSEYAISLTESSVAPGADLYEPDDAPAQAARIDTDGTPQTHTFHATTDADYVFFVAVEGAEYTIETGSLEADCDTVMFLYDGSGAELDNDDDAGEEDLASRIVWIAPSGGTYYVKVTDFAGLAGPDVSYQIWVSTP